MPTLFLTQTMPRILLGAGGVVAALFLLLLILSFRRRVKEADGTWKQRVSKAFRSLYTKKQ